MAPTDTPELSLRPVVLADARLLFDWANDPEALRHSFSSGALEWREHRYWLQDKLADPLCHFYVVEHEGTPVGQIRFDLKAVDSAAVISVSLDPSRRGEGLGTAAIRAGVARLQQDAEVAVVHAFIKQTNPASLRVFHKAGFRDTRNGPDPQIARLSLELAPS